MTLFITTGSFPQGLRPGLSGWFNDELRSHQTEYDKIYRTEPSKRAFEQFSSQTHLGLFQSLGEGGPVPLDTIRQNFTQTFWMLEYALGIGITKNMLDDGQWASPVKRRLEELAISQTETLEVLGAQPLNRATNASYTGADGVTLLNAAHPNGGGMGGTQSNVLSPGSDINELAIERIFYLTSAYTDTAGKKKNLRMKKLLCHPDKFPKAQKVLLTTQEVGTANNTINFARTLVEDGAMMLHWLTNANMWFIQTDAKDGLTYFERKKRYDRSDIDVLTGNLIHVAGFRCHFNYLHWACLYGSTSP